MIKALLFSICGIFFSVFGWFVLYPIAIIIPVFGLFLLEYWAVIYMILAIIFSLHHGYFCASKTVNLAPLCALINGAVLIIPTLFSQDLLVLTLTFIACTGGSMFFYYTFLPKIEYKRRIEEEQKNENITDAEDYARLQYIISKYSEKK